MAIQDPETFKIQNMKDQRGASMHITAKAPTMRIKGSTLKVGGMTSSQIKRPMDLNNKIFLSRHSRSQEGMD